MKIQYVNSTDVLVIGMGGAGIKASICAADGGAKVLMVGKFPFGRTGATFYPGTPGWGMQAVIHEGDTEEYFLEEILEAGAGAADVELARVLATQATKRFHELEDYGLRFGQYEDGRYKGVFPCFGKRLRGSSTMGMDKIRATMWRQLMQRNIQIRSGLSVVSLVKKDGAVVGAVALDEQNQFCFISAKAVILATGGACGIYQYSLATPDETGDGYILALDAGASLVNLEFIQFIPGLTWPVQKLLFQEKNLDTIPKFTNRFGEDVVAKYLPSQYTEEQCLIERAKHGPFTTADISSYVDVGMYEEVIAGNGMERATPAASGGIHVAYDSKVLKDDRWVITSWLEWMASRGVRPVEEGFDMIPHAQCFNGGIYIDTHAGARVPGLYAAGETAGGAHGADRLGGAAIAATQVFGALAGESAAQYAKGVNRTEVSPSQIEEQLEQKFGRPEGSLLDLKASMAEIRQIMWECGAVVRTEERCKQGIARIEALEQQFHPAAHFAAAQSGQPSDIRQVNELYSYLHLSKTLLAIMQERRESRGPHYRSDYPEKDSRYDGVMAVKKVDGRYQFSIQK